MMIHASRSRSADWRGVGRLGLQIGAGQGLIDEEGDPIVAQLGVPVCRREIVVRAIDTV